MIEERERLVLVEVAPPLTLGEWIKWGEELAAAGLTPEAAEFLAIVEPVVLNGYELLSLAWERALALGIHPQPEIHTIDERFFEGAFLSREDEEDLWAHEAAYLNTVGR